MFLISATFVVPFSPFPTSQTLLSSSNTVTVRGEKLLLPREDSAEDSVNNNSLLSVPLVHGDSVRVASASFRLEYSPPKTVKVLLVV